MIDNTLPLVNLKNNNKELALTPNVSYGIAPILNTLVGLTSRVNKPHWSLYLVNVETIIRDRKEEPKINEAYGQSVIYDMQMLSQYIAAYNRLSSTVRVQKKAVLCFYFPHYDVVPKMYLRDKFPKGTEDRWKIRDIVMNLIQKQPLPAAYENVDVIYTAVGKKTWPHKELLNDLVKHQQGIRFSDTLMISHVPLDFHLYKQLQNFNILESYTGALKNPKQLGKKVFKEDVFPFNKYLHLLLGDKWYLKALVNGATKNKMKERAKKEHWAIISDKAVLASLINMNPIIQDAYIKPDI